MIKYSGKTKCNLCGSSRHTLVFKKKATTQPFSSSNRYRISEAHLGQPDKIVKCVSCDLVYAIPDISTKIIVKDYVASVDEEYVSEERGMKTRMISFG